MTSIAFYLNNPNIHEPDLSEILTKSYRIGGTELEILLVSYNLELKDNGIQPCLLTNYEGKLPHKSYARVENLDQCCEYCVSHNIDRVVIDIKQFKEEIISKYSHQLKFIIWAHNDAPEPVLNKFLKYSCIEKIICVSQTQKRWYDYHPASLKTDYIYNIIPYKDKDFYKRRVKRDGNHNVVYIGCLAPIKGFHALAKAWPQIIAKTPDAHLYVIGSGQLYNHNELMGKYGVATQDYEDLIMPYLTDKGGAILPSVHFLGLMGEEKYDVLGACKVGVPNPVGSSETFCITGLEMQLMGCSVTTIRIPVFEETQLHQDYLYSDVSMLSDYVIKRLESDPEDFEEQYNFVTSKFNLEQSISRWEMLIKTHEPEEISFPKKKLRSFALEVSKILWPPFRLMYNFLNYRLHLVFGK